MLALPPRKDKIFSGIKSQKKCYVQTKASHIGSCPWLAASLRSGPEDPEHIFRHSPGPGHWESNPQIPVPSTRQRGNPCWALAGSFGRLQMLPSAAWRRDVSLWHSDNGSFKGSLKSPHLLPPSLCKSLADGHVMTWRGWHGLPWAHERERAAQQHAGSAVRYLHRSTTLSCMGVCVPARVAAGMRNGSRGGTRLHNWNTLPNNSIQATFFYLDNSASRPAFSTSGFLTWHMCVIIANWFQFTYLELCAVHWRSLFLQ